MRPTSYKELIKLTAEQLNLPEEVVHDLIIYYYKDVRKALSTLEGPRVVISGLGNFNIKHWKLKDQLSKLLRMFKSYESYNSKQSELIRVDIQKKIDQLQGMTTMWEGETIRKQKIKKKRRELEKEYNDRLAKQMENTGGNLEHIVSESENKTDSEEASSNM